MNIFEAEKFGYNWLEWFGIVIYFISVLACAVAAVGAIALLLNYIVEEIKWKYLNWKADRDERK